MCNSNLTGNVTASESRNTAYAAVFGAIIAVGLPLNALSLWILLRRHSIKTPSAVFMVNLAISDLLLAISLTARVYYHATGSWRLGGMACIWMTMIFRNNIRSSSIFITFISMDRLLAVVYPLRSRHIRTSTKAWTAVASIWIFVLIMNIPESVYMKRFMVEKNITTCFEFCPRHESPLKFFQPMLVFTMLAINIVCTILVSRTLNRHLNDSAKIRNKVNVMLIFAMNLMMFTIFFFPLSLAVIVPISGLKLMPLLCLASVNCCLDPLLYYFSFDGFWKRQEDGDSSLARE